MIAGETPHGGRYGARHQERGEVKGEHGAPLLDAEGRKRVAEAIAVDCGWPDVEAMRAGVAAVLRGSRPMR